MFDAGLLLCPNCGGSMKMGHVCGEYFVFSKAIGCDWCNGFLEMHTTAEEEREAWNGAVKRGAYIVKEETK